jgi:hypothetical protein
MKMPIIPALALFLTACGPPPPPFSTTDIEISLTCGPTTLVPLTRPTQFGSLKMRPGIPIPSTYREIQIDSATTNTMHSMPYSLSSKLDKMVIHPGDRISIRCK